MEPYRNKKLPPYSWEEKVQERLTRGRLKKLHELPEWEQSEYLQLDQYEVQEMFNIPGDLPKKGTFNVLPMIWNYLVKNCRRKKARCVASVSPTQKGSIVLANTYAAYVEQPAARIFWATAAIKNLLVFGADCSNAFAEASPPTEPLYMKIDK